MWPVLYLLSTCKCTEYSPGSSLCLVSGEIKRAAEQFDSTEDGQCVELEGNLATNSAWVGWIVYMQAHVTITRCRQSETARTRIAGAYCEIVVLV
jgi:hypothetical protein